MLNSSQSFIQKLSWGYKAPNDTYFQDGIYAEIQNGRAEIAGAGFYRADRQEIVEYISIASPSDVKFILKTPPLSYVHNLFMLAFEQMVWYSLCLVTGITIVILYIVIKFENRYKNILDKENNVGEIQPKLFDVIMVQVGVFTQQGSDVEPRTYSGRISFFMISLIMMFLFTAYSANIVVLLQSVSNSIQTVNDLLDSNIELGAEDTVYNRYYIENQQEWIRKAIVEKKMKSQKSNYMNLTEGVKRLRRSFFGFHVETTSGYKVVMDTFQEHEKCGLVEVDFIDALWPTISVKKNSSYKEVIKVGFRKIHERGIRHRQVNRIYITKPKCGGTRGSFVNVGLLEVYFPFVIFGLGIAASGFLLVMEICFKKYCYKKILKVFK